MSDHPRGRFAVWILVALAGLAVAVALSVAASNLSTQPIGLSDEPLRAGARLAPPEATVTPASVKPKRRRKHKVTHPAHASPTTTAPLPTETLSSPAPEPTVTTPTTTSREPGDDHGGGHPDRDDD